MLTSVEYIRQMATEKKPLLAYHDESELVTWQKNAREKMTELLGLPLEYCSNDFTVLEDIDCKGYRHIRFTFQSELGYYVPCSLLIPDGIDKPVPCVICLQGHTTGAHVSLGTVKFQDDEQLIEEGNDFAIQAVSRGYCAIALEMRYMGQLGQTEEGNPSCSKLNTALTTLLVGRTAIGERVWDVHRLIDVIEAHLTEYIDTEKIVCMGHSGGGTATYFAACYDERIYLAVPSCSVCTFDASIMAMRHCCCNYVPGIRKYFNMGDLGCLIAPRPLIVVCGIYDPIFPLHGVEASYAVIQKAYKKAGSQEMCRLVKGNGEHRFYPDDVWPIVKQYMKD